MNPSTSYPHQHSAALHLAALNPQHHQHQHQQHYGAARSLYPTHAHAHAAALMMNPLLMQQSLQQPSMMGLNHLMLQQHPHTQQQLYQQHQQYQHLTAQHQHQQRVGKSGNIPSIMPLTLPSAAALSSSLSQGAMPLDPNNPPVKPVKKKRGRRERERLKRRLAREAEAAALAAGGGVLPPGEKGDESSEDEDDGVEGEQSATNTTNTINRPSSSSPNATAGRGHVRSASQGQTQSGTQSFHSQPQPQQQARSIQPQQQPMPLTMQLPMSMTPSLYSHPSLTAFMTPSLYAHTAPFTQTSTLSHQSLAHLQSQPVSVEEPQVRSALANTNTRSTEGEKSGGGVILLVNEGSHANDVSSLMSQLTLSKQSSAPSTSSERREGEVEHSNTHTGEGEQTRSRRAIAGSQPVRRARSISPSSMSLSLSSTMSYPDDNTDPLSTFSQPSMSSSMSSRSSLSSVSQSQSSRASRRFRSKSIDRSVSGYLTQSPSSTPSLSSSMHHHRRHASSSSLSPSRKIETHKVKAMTAVPPPAASTNAAAPAPAQAPEVRQQLVSYISSPQCRLFSSIQGFFQVSHEHLDALIAAGGSLTNTLVRLGKLDVKGKKFTSMPSLIEAVEQAEARAKNKKRKQVLSFFANPQCKLFAGVSQVEVTVSELDQLIRSCESAQSTSSSASVRALLKLLGQLNERGQRFESVRSMIPVIVVMHEKEEQARKHDELTAQLQAQQQQLLLLQSQLMSQQVMPLAGFSANPSVNVSGSGSAGYDNYVETFLAAQAAQHQLPHHHQHYHTGGHSQHQHGHQSGHTGSEYYNVEQQLGLMHGVGLYNSMGQYGQQASDPLQSPQSGHSTHSHRM